MDSMSSNLNASLPLNIEEDAELADRFKDSALAITALFKHAQKSRKAAFVQGYLSCVSDLRDYIRSNAEPERPLTVGVIFDYLEGRQAQLLRDLDASLGNGPANTVSGSSTSSNISQQKAQPATSPSPAATGNVRPKSPNSQHQSKRPSPKLVNASPTRVAAWTSPSLSPSTFVAEPVWSEVTPVETINAPAFTSWPEVSMLSALPIPPSNTLSNTLPNAGGKRKRDALVELDLRTNINVEASHHRRHGGTKKRRGNVNKGRNAQSLGASEDWSMELDDEQAGRDRKRQKA